MKTTLQYVRQPEWSGDVLRDIRGLLTLNG